MAETLLTDATTILLRVTSLLAEEEALIVNLNSELSKLRDMLAMIQALLHDTEQKRMRNQEAVKLWLKKLDDITYEAADVLDEVEYEVLRSKVNPIPNNLIEKVCNFFSPSNPILFSLNIAYKIRGIRSSLDNIRNDAISFGLREQYAAMAAAPVTEIPAIETHSFVDNSEVVGRETEISKVVDILIGSDNRGALSIIPIVGMAGIGKTTFAQCVYNNEKVKRHFDATMWVCVSDDFDVKRILKEMLESLANKKYSMENLDSILQDLQKKLGGKKYLLVFDDVWNEEKQKWESLIDCLIGIGTNAGSCIIITTRRDSVAAITETLPRLHLKQLLDGDCWSIFEQRAFGNPSGAPKIPEFVSIGMQIVRKCRGVPLAAKALGGTMRSKNKIEEWQFIQNSEIWNSPEEQSGILSALKLSFHHLPSPSLKKCFAYCSIFSKDYAIEKDSLIQLWMAQGLLQPQESSQTMEQVGDKYFNTLLWNSMLQDVEKDEFDNIIGCKMHDLVHDLALSISRSDFLMVKANEINDISGFRHLSLIPTDEIVQEKIKVGNQKLWTLFSMEYVSFDSLSSFKCLRVLMLAHSVIEELPASIGDLKHLRCIDISSTPLKTLPDSISELFHLQTLRLGGCNSLNGLPKGFKNLLSLRHLYIDDRDVYMHRYASKWKLAEIGQLSSLQTLPLFVVGQEKGCQIGELGSLCNLRNELKIYGLEHVMGRQEAERANISKKSDICSLVLHWSRIYKMYDEEKILQRHEGVLEGLQPHSNVKGLTINNFHGEKFPQWMMDRHMSVLGNLVKIELVNCDRSAQLPSLGRLPFLKVLTIKGMREVKQIGPEFYGTNMCDGTANSSSSSYASCSSAPTSTLVLFPSLRKFNLSGLYGLQEWVEPVLALPSTARIMAFPVLEELEIRDCPELTTIPAGQLSFIKSLCLADIKEGLQLAEISSKLTSLTTLSLGGKGLTCVLEELMHNNKSLRKLHVANCDDLRSLPNTLQSLVSLETLRVFSCPGLTRIPDLRSLTSLEKLFVIFCDALTCLPELQRMQSLRQLTLDGCASISSWPKGLHFLTGLRRLEIGDFSRELESFPWPNNAGEIQQLVSLQELRLWGWTKLRTLPDAIQHLPSLKTLGIFKFRGLVELPDWLGNLSSLRYLTVAYCYDLSHLPAAAAMHRLSKLKHFEILYCPLLKVACAKGWGPEWSKIAHIPRVSIRSWDD